MEKNFSNELCIISYDADRKYLFHTWKQATKDADWEEIKVAFIKYVEYVEHFKPEKILVNEADMQHIFVPEEQEWIDIHMMPRVLVNEAEKTAIVQSQDVFVEMATDMMMKKDSAVKIQSRFFGSIEDAEDWLFS